MRIVIGLGHPAHYHLFKGIIRYFTNNKIDFKIAILEKNGLGYLLERDNIPYVEIVKKVQSNKLKIKYDEQKKSNKAFRDLIKEFKPTLLIGCINQIAHLGWRENIKSIFFAEDDFKATYLQGILIYPFISKIVTPSCTDLTIFKYKQIKYAGYHELSYLHPSIFKPEKSKIKNLIKDNKPYFILRFSDLTAYHDVNRQGIDEDFAQKIIESLKVHGNIFITTEKKINDNFNEYIININPQDIHHALYYAKLFIGDSQTMTAEAAILGTPALRYNDFVGKLGYLKELEDTYGLAYGFKRNQPALLLDKINELIRTENLHDIWVKKREKMLNDKINVTDFFIWFIENLPESSKIMKENPDYQYRFR